MNRTPSRSSVLRSAYLLPLAVLVVALAAQPVLAQAPASTQPASPTFDPPTPAEADTPPPEADRHESGLVTLVLHNGDGDRSPLEEDIVTFHFTGWDRAGTKFASSRDGDRPSPMTLPMSKLFPGWRMALSDMVIGDQRRVWVPENLGPKSNQGPPSAVFDVELVAIRTLPDKPPMQAPAEAQRSASGAKWLQIKAAESEESPPKGGTALLSWTQWAPNGNVVQSTEMRGRPTAFMLDRVFVGFAEIVEQMKVGEARYVWIPAAVHGGQWPGAAPNQPLILYVELVQVLPNQMLPRQS